MELTEEQKNKIIKIRQMLKDNAPYVYKLFASRKLYKENTKIELTKQEEVKKEDVINSNDCPF